MAINPNFVNGLKLVKEAEQYFDGILDTYFGWGYQNISIPCDNIQSKYPMSEKAFEQFIENYRSVGWTIAKENGWLHISRP